MSSSTPYTRLPKRFKALLIDGLFLGLAFYASIYLVKMLAIKSPLFESIVILLIVGSIEPLFISITGSSLGQHIAGLRVRRASVDKRLNVFLSYIRFFFKIPLGAISLLTVLTTRKHQAIHDLISNSIVVHKSPELLRPYDVIPERIEDTDRYIYPSKSRRFFLILVYWLLGGILLATTSTAYISDACVIDRACSKLEDISQVLLSLAFWISVYTIVWLGWQGRLYGARKKQRVLKNEKIN